MLCGLAGDSAGQRIVRAIAAAHAEDPWPVRVVLHPLSRRHELWRPYMARHQQNQVHQYHNGGLWPFVGGFWVLALARLGLRRQAQHALHALAQANAQADWRFTEWFHGRTLAPLGMAGQSWNAATFLLAEAALHGQPGSPGLIAGGRERPATHSPAAARVAPARRTLGLAACLRSPVKLPCWR